MRPIKTIELPDYEPRPLSPEMVQLSRRLTKIYMIAICACTIVTAVAVIVMPRGPISSSEPIRIDHASPPSIKSPVMK